MSSAIYKSPFGGVFRNTDNRYKQNEMHWRNCWNTGTCKSSVHLILTYYISMFWTNRERLYSHVHVVCRHFHSVIRKQNNAFLMFCSISHHIWTKPQWKVITDSNYQHNSFNWFQIHLSRVTRSAGDKNKLKWTFVAAAHPYMNLNKEHGLEFGHTSICFGQNVEASESDAHSHSPHHLKLNLLFTHSKKFTVEDFFFPYKSNSHQWAYFFLINCKLQW